MHRKNHHHRYEPGHILTSRDDLPKTTHFQAGKHTQGDKEQDALGPSHKKDTCHQVPAHRDHTDHLDSGTILPILQTNPGIVVIVSESNREFAADRLGIESKRLTGLTVDQTLTIGPFAFHAVPSAHENLDFDENGNPKYMGLIFQAGPWTIYHSGDTVRYPGMAEQLRLWEINIAMLPINGSDPKRRVAGNLSAQEAAELGRDMGAGLVIPCHYEMFEFNTASPEDFVRAAQAVGQGYRVLKCGERFDLGG